MINLSEQKMLTEAALKAREKSYSPYSHFAVGAALLSADGKVFTGCNIESASYSATVCAERTAVFKAVSEGCRDFSAAAIVGGPAGEPVSGFCPPCGICRQVFAEFCDPDSFEIVLSNGSSIQNFLLRELLPHSFSPKDLAGR